MTNTNMILFTLLEEIYQFKNSLVSLSSAINTSYTLGIIVLLWLIILLAYRILIADRPPSPEDSPPVAANNPPATTDNPPASGDSPPASIDSPIIPSSAPNRYLDGFDELWENSDVLGIFSYSRPTRERGPLYNRITKRWIYPGQPGYEVLAGRVDLTPRDYIVAERNIRMVNRFVVTYQDNISSRIRTLTFFRYPTRYIHSYRTERLYRFDETSPYFQCCLVQAIMQHGQIRDWHRVPVHRVGFGLLHGWSRMYIDEYTGINGDRH